MLPISVVFSTTLKSRVVRSLNVEYECMYPYTYCIDRLSLPWIYLTLKRCPNTHIRLGMLTVARVPGGGAGEFEASMIDVIDDRVPCSISPKWPSPTCPNWYGREITYSVCGTLYDIERTKMLVSTYSLYGIEENSLLCHREYYMHCKCFLYPKDSENIYLYLKIFKLFPKNIILAVPSLKGNNSFSVSSRHNYSIFLTNCSE